MSAFFATWHLLELVSFGNDDLPSVVLGLGIVQLHLTGLVLLEHVRYFGVQVDACKTNHQIEPPKRKSTMSGLKIP